MANAWAMRVCVARLDIEPAYADDDQVAQALIISVLRTCADNESAELTIPGTVLNQSIISIEPKL